MRAYLHHTTLTSALGRGNARDARRASRAAQRSCAQRLRGRSPATPGPASSTKLDGVALPIGMEQFDCRSNRLTELALLQDGFADAVLATREKYGAHRVGLYVGTSSAGILEVELGYRVRNDEVKALPDGLRYREAMNLFSPAAYVRERFEIAGPAVVGVVRVLVEREGVRRRVARDRGGPVRRGDRRRRRDAVPDDAARVRVARAAVADAVPSLRRGARRHLARRGGGLRAADARTRRRARSRCSATARARTRTICRRRIRKASARRSRCASALAMARLDACATSTT